CAVGCKKLGPLPRGKGRSSAAGLVEPRMVLYPLSAAGCGVVSLQHDFVHAGDRHRMAADTLQADLNKRDAGILAFSRPCWRILKPLPRRGKSLLSKQNQAVCGTL